MINEKILTKFINMYEHDFGKKLSRTEALSLFTELVSVVKLVLQKEPSTNPDNNAIMDKL